MNFIVYQIISFKYTENMFPLKSLNGWKGVNKNGQNNKNVFSLDQLTIKRVYYVVDQVMSINCIKYMFSYQYFNHQKELETK